MEGEGVTPASKWGKGLLLPLDVDAGCGGAILGLNLEERAGGVVGDDGQTLTVVGFVHIVHIDTHRTLGGEFPNGECVESHTEIVDGVGVSIAVDVAVEHLVGVATIHIGCAEAHGRCHLGDELTIDHLVAEVALVGHRDGLAGGEADDSPQGGGAGNKLPLLVIDLEVVGGGKTVDVAHPDLYGDVLELARQSPDIHCHTQQHPSAILSKGVVVVVFKKSIGEGSRKDVVGHTHKSESLGKVGLVGLYAICV